MGVFSSFAVACSYISPSTGIFFSSWPLVALGQFVIVLGFAELSSHPVATRAPTPARRA